MKTFLQTILIISGLGLFANAVSAQKPEENISREEMDRRIAQQTQSATQHQDRALEQVNQTKIDTDGRDLKNSQQKEEFDQYLATRAAAGKYAEQLQQKLIAPPGYTEKYADQLKKMNLVRIFTDKNCDLMEKKLVSAEDAERCADVVPFAGGGSNYSFKEKTNVYYGNVESDIHFINNKFITGNSLVIRGPRVTGNEIATGIISEIGDVDLQNINLQSNASKFLAESRSEKSLLKVKEQNKILEKGVSLNGFDYSVSSPLKLNSTYVLRSIAYKAKLGMVKYPNGKMYFGKTDDLKIVKDIIVAFKVVGQEPDGSVILLWKKLK